ncbi:hypothetical protein ACFW1M_38125 [Streptomyces inhibens]|uniref:hypothetical protein n=1 Tax=Streptomyces inhibens TaxID=2293571 RepID=UPI003697E9AD
MVPVVQLFARDVPRLKFPADKDVLQLIWCLLIHPEDLASALQNKVGGYPAWTQPPKWPHCARGRRMEHLLSVTEEPGYGRWLPLDEHRPGDTQPLWQSPADPAVLETLGPDMDMGDAGGICVFLCRQCPDLPYAHRFDCH